MNNKQKLFVNEYLKDCNAKQAAIRAGYSPDTAAEKGYQLRNVPEIKEAIEARIANLRISSDEVVRGIEDIARTNLADYFVETVKEYTPRIRKSVVDIIAEIEAEIDFEEEYAKAVTLNEDELKDHLKYQESRRKRIIRFKIELSKDPNATRIVNGETELIKATKLDMNALVADKSVKIKSVKPTEFGLAIETYSADAAQDKLAKMYGLYEKDNKQKAVVLPVIIEWGEDGNADQ